MASVLAWTMLAVAAGMVPASANGGSSAQSDSASRIGSMLSNQTPYGGGVVPGAGFCNDPALTMQRPLVLPDDDAPHSTDPTNYWEWWYWRGHLQTRSGRKYGFVTVFESKPQLGLQQTLATIADVAGKKLHYARSAERGGPIARTGGFSLRGPHSWAVGGGGRDRIHQEVDGDVLDVLLTTRKPTVPLFEDGYFSAYCNGGFYYQRQRMTLRGRFRRNGATTRVRGAAWFDHFWGFAPGYQGAQTDYLQLELADGRDIFIGIARFPRFTNGPTVVDLRFGTIRDRTGKVTDLKHDDFKLTPTDYFRPTPTCSYPIAFTLDVQGRRYTIKPLIRDAEIRSDSDPLLNVLWAEDATLWDGPGTVGGDGAGNAWLDFVGYCPGR